MVGKVMGWICYFVVSGLYGYLVVAAVGNLTQFPVLAARLGVGVTVNGWLWLGVGVAMPVLGYLLALFIAHRHQRRHGGGMASRLLVLVTALAVLAVLQLEISLLVPPVSFFAI